MKRSSRALPYPKEAEQSVLGAILLEPSSLEKVSDILTYDGSDFYHPAHQQIYKGIIGLLNKKIPIDIVTISDLFKGSEALESVGGVVYLVELLESTPTAANVAYYARIVKDKAIRRSLILSATEAIEAAYETEEETTALIDRVQKQVNGLTFNSSVRSYVSLKELIPQVFEKLEALSEGKGITGTPTGIDDLDYFLGGLQGGDLVIIAGRPSMGKSSLTCQVATNIAIEGKKVGYFSPEVNNNQVVKNVLACQGRIDTTKFRNGQLSEEEWGKLSKAIAGVYETNMYLDDFSFSSTEILSQARRMRSNGGLDIVFIDHLSEIQELGRFESKDKEVNFSIGNFKRLAKEMNIPVIVVCQLNRAVDARGGDFRPRLSDLRDSGAIEQRADIVMFVYREGYYMKDKCDNPDVAEVIIAKHRNGPIGTVQLKWNAQWLRFDELWRGNVSY